MAVSLVALPVTLGFAYAFLWLPVYAGVCSEAAFAPMPADKYRIFLLNRGCDLDEAITEIARSMEADPATLHDLYGGKEPTTSEEVMWADALQAGLRSFVPLRTRAGACPPEDAYCPQRYGWSNDVLSNLIRKAAAPYGNYAKRQFVQGVNDGADFVSGVLAMGTVMRGMLLLGYGLIAAVAVAAAMRVLRSFFTGG
jgi:hypothetical protein